jgi:hypothetical protein
LILRLWFSAVITAGLLSNAAPADKYFGRLKMSALRIRYEVQELKRDYEYHRRLPDVVLHFLAYTQEAYYEWAAAYPKDAWLPSTGYNLGKLFEELPGYGARDGAVRALQFVRSHFKNTRYSKLSVADLRRGIAVKPVPAWAVRSTATPSPTPTGTASPAPTPSASTPSAPLVMLSSSKHDLFA